MSSIAVQVLLQQLENVLLIRSYVSVNPGPYRQRQDAGYAASEFKHRGVGCYSRRFRQDVVFGNQPFGEQRGYLPDHCQTGCYA